MNIYGVEFDRNLNQVYNNYTFVRDPENLEFIVISEAQKLISDMSQAAELERKEFQADSSRIGRKII